MRGRRWSRPIASAPRAAAHGSQNGVHRALPFGARLSVCVPKGRWQRDAAGAAGNRGRGSRPDRRHDAPIRDGERRLSPRAWRRSRRRCRSSAPACRACGSRAPRLAPQLRRCSSVLSALVMSRSRPSWSCEVERPGAAVVGVLDPDHREAAHADVAAACPSRRPSAPRRRLPDDQMLAARLQVNRSSSRHSSSVRNRRRKATSRSLSRTSNSLVGAGRGLALLGRPAEALLDVVPDHEADMVRVEAARMRADHLVVAHQELEVELLRQVERFMIWWCQKLAHPSFMILVSICGMK